MQNNNLELLNAIYKNVTMGCQSLESLISKIEDSSLKTNIELQKSDYNSFIAKTEKLAMDYDTDIKPSNILIKKSAEISIGLHTLLNTETSKIAEMVIQGSTMGIIEITKSLNSVGNCENNIKQLANDVLNFERNNVERMKNYL